MAVERNEKGEAQEAKQASNSNSRNVHHRKNAITTRDANTHKTEVLSSVFPFLCASYAGGGGGGGVA